MWTLKKNADYPKTFTSETEKRFGIEHLRCDGRECDAHGLPMDGERASWLKSNRYETGTFIVDGNKVGLAGSNGELLSPNGNR
ncbi:hypothetical protein JS541_10050 [Bifidobacterium sp. SO1]|nr:hypothetical protein [Bifidobacterium sp. SO1]